MTVPLRCVLDTNICIKQFIVDPWSPKVNQLFDCLDDPAVEFFVPDLFYIECANALWKYVRANLYTAEQVQADLSDLKALRFQVISTKDLMNKIGWEQPREFSPRESENTPIRILQVTGLDSVAGREIFRDIGSYSR